MLAGASEQWRMAAFSLVDARLLRERLPCPLRRQGDNLSLMHRCRLLHPGVYQSVAEQLRSLVQRIAPTGTSLPRFCGSLAEFHRCIPGLAGGMAVADM